MLSPTALTDISQSHQHAADTAPFASAPPGVVGALRAATAARHELVHRIMPLSVDSIAVDDYLAHLLVLRAWLAPLQAWLDTFCDGPQAAGANRLALIDADLAGPSAYSQELSLPVADATAAPHWSGHRSAAYRWGVSYVIEGSRLGGAVLYAQLRERLAPHPLSYLKVGREALGPRWQAFNFAIGADVQKPDAIREACEGASDAFDSLIGLARQQSETPRASGGWTRG
jgi:heme oxygenase (biliverdin-IX-beta and delta-forming)